MAEIEGLKELDRKLANMETKVAKKIVRKAVRNAQNIALKEARSNAQAMVGGDLGAKLALALKVKPVNKQKKGSYALQVVIDPAKAEELKHTTKDGKTYYIPTAVEYGHRKAGGGQVPGIPFMRKASDATEKARVAEFVKELKKGIEKA